MKRFLTLLAVTFCLICTFMAATANESRKLTEELTNQLTAEISLDQDVKSQVNRSFIVFSKAFDKMLLSICTQRLADFQHVGLKPAFYRAQKMKISQFSSAKISFLNALNRANTQHGNRISAAIERVSPVLDTMSSMNAKTITRGYCQTYRKGMAEAVLKNFNKYKVASHNTVEPASVSANSIYADENMRIIKVTTNINRKQIPTKLVVNKKTFPISCQYINVEGYLKAIAIKQPIKGLAYKATRIFYQNYSPQVDAILYCKTNSKITSSVQKQISDTFPWYQPIIKSGDNKRAAGDALMYVDGKDFSMVLGHESCACNWNSQADCNKLNKASRKYKMHAWEMLDALEKGKNEINSQDQQKINAYLNWASQEVNKDYCYIDKKAVLSRFDKELLNVNKIDSLASKVKNHLKASTIYLDPKLGLNNITVNLVSHQQPLFYQIGMQSPAKIQCVYKNVEEVKNRILGNNTGNDLVLKRTKQFYNQVSPNIDYIIACRGRLSVRKPAITIKDTDNWYKGPFSQHINAYTKGRSLAYVSPKDMILIIGHRPCICTKMSEVDCLNFMVHVREGDAANFVLRKRLKKALVSKGITEHTKELIKKCFVVMEKNKNLDPCDQNIKEIDSLLVQVKASAGHDIKNYEKNRHWWWPF